MTPTTTKHNLYPEKGIAKTVIPNERPDFNAWAQYIHKESTADEAETYRTKQINHNQK